jgi:hypothetical protein
MIKEYAMSSVACHCPAVLCMQAAGLGAGGSLLQALQRRNRLRPACMSVALAERDESLVLEDDASADTTPVLEVRYLVKETFDAAAMSARHADVSCCLNEAGVCAVLGHAA